VSAVIDSLAPRPLIEAMLDGEVCPPRATIEAALEAHGVDEAPLVAARLQLRWHRRHRHDPCPSSVCCDEVARFEGETRACMTSRHAAALADWHDEWLRIGCDTAPADRPRAEAAIAALYRDVGADPPPFVWVSSPAAAAEVFLSRTPPGAFLRDRFTNPGNQTDRIDDALWGFLSREHEGPLDELMKMKERLRARLGDQLGRCVGAAVAARVGSRFPGSGSAEGPRFEGAPRGQHEAYWIAMHTFARDVVGVWYPRLWSRRLDLWAEAARACNRWWPFERCCVISERPSAIRWDQAGRLHGAAGPAVTFRDGFGCYVWRGIWVPPSWIESPQSFEPARALTWPNLEQRRAAVEILGWGRIIDACTSLLIDKDPDPTIGELLELQLPGTGAARFLRVRCGTGREFVLSVPRGMGTAREANAWTYGLSPEELQLEART
jgi:hypothetical protein